MKIADLQRLTDIWRLARSDPGTQAIYLEETCAFVSGLHYDVARYLPPESPLPLTAPTCLNGEKIVGALALFDPEAEVTVERASASLVLTAGKRRAVLQLLPAAPLRPLRLEQPESVFDPEPLRKAVTFLRGCASGGVINPVLTGIRFSGSDGKLPLIGMDGERRVGIVRLALAVKTRGQVVPAGDLDEALSLLNGNVSLRLTRQHCYIGDDRTAIKISLLQGDFPSLRTLPKPDSYKYRVKLDPEVIGTAVRAAMLLDSDRVITFQIKDGNASWIVRGTEIGGFRISAGRNPHKNISIRFDAHYLEAALGLGDAVTMRYTRVDEPILFVGRHTGYLLWMSPIIY